MVAHNHQDVTMQQGVACIGGSFLLRLVLAIVIILAFAVLSRAGGPNLIAGTTYFDSSVTGQPLVWPQGAIIYYTDQGDLSPCCRTPQPTVLSPAHSASGHRFRRRL